MTEGRLFISIIRIRIPDPLYVEVDFIVAVLVSFEIIVFYRYSRTSLTPTRRGPTHFFSFRGYSVFQNFCIIGYSMLIYQLCKNRDHGLASGSKSVSVCCILKVAYIQFKAFLCCKHLITYILRLTLSLKISSVPKLVSFNTNLQALVDAEVGGTSDKSKIWLFGLVLLLR